MAARIGLSGTDDAYEESRCGLGGRDAFGDWAHVESDLLIGDQDRERPVATIAIPTYLRGHLLPDAVRSAFAQDWTGAFEVVVLDNDPHSDGAAALLSEVPELAGKNFRYFRNRENVGMFGNFNRCVELARGEWMTFLMDDDLLDANFLSATMAAVEEVPGVDGISCRKRYRDIRPVSVAARRVPSLPQRGRARLRRALVRGVRKPIYAWHFKGRETRRLTRNQFFWGPVAGTPAGFLFRRSRALAIGGYLPEEFPASDFWFYARFAERFHLRQHRSVMATCRILENESNKPETMMRSLASVQRLQHTLLAHGAPRWWRRFAPLVIARLLRGSEPALSRKPAARELAEALGGAPAADRPLYLAAVRLLAGGWHPDPA